MKKGVPVSPGVAVANVHLLEGVAGSAHLGPTQLDAAGLSAEVNRFERACAAVARELDETITRVTRQIGEEEAAIFRAHRLLVRDPAFVGKVKSIIVHRHVDAPTALHETLEPAVVDRHARPQQQILDIHGGKAQRLAALIERGQPAGRKTEPPRLHDDCFR